MLIQSTAAIIAVIVTSRIGEAPKPPGTTISQVLQQHRTLQKDKETLQRYRIDSAAWLRRNQNAVKSDRERFVAELTRLQAMSDDCSRKQAACEALKKYTACPNNLPFSQCTHGTLKVAHQTALGNALNEYQRVYRSVFETRTMLLNLRDDLELQRKTFLRNRNKIIDKNVKVTKKLSEIERRESEIKERFDKLQKTTLETAGEQENSPPVGFAFGNGVFNADRISPLRISGAADVVLEHGRVPRTVQHLRVISVETNNAASRDNRTSFVYVESVFVPTLTGSPSLDEVRVESVRLNHEGRPIKSLTRAWKYKLYYVDQKWIWIRTAGKGRSASVFYKSLPNWATIKLHQVSGFLLRNPGMPVVSYENAIEDVLEVASLLITLTPQLRLVKAVPLVNRVIDQGIKQGGMALLKRMVASGELRFGIASDIENERAIREAATYKLLGKAIWSNDK